MTDVDEEAYPVHPRAFSPRRPHLRYFHTSRANDCSSRVLLVYTTHGTLQPYSPVTSQRRIRVLNPLHGQCLRRSEVVYYAVPSSQANSFRSFSLFCLAFSAQVLMTGSGVGL